MSFSRRESTRSASVSRPRDHFADPPGRLPIFSKMRGCCNVDEDAMLHISKVVLMFPRASCTAPRPLLAYFLHGEPVDLPLPIALFIVLVTLSLLIRGDVPKEKRFGNGIIW